VEDTPATTTDAVAEDITTTTASTAAEEDAPVEADPVPKGNDKLLIIGAVVGGVVLLAGIGVVIALLLEKRK
jgi:hypothetical protein